jgi:hypothetical protein
MPGPVGRHLDPGECDAHTPGAGESSSRRTVAGPARTPVVTGAPGGPAACSAVSRDESAQAGLRSGCESMQFVERNLHGEEHAPCLGGRHSRQAVSRVIASPRLVTDVTAALRHEPCTVLGGNLRLMRTAIQRPAGATEAHRDTVDPLSLFMNRAASGVGYVGRPRSWACPAEVGFT